jgi:hypothetical protein
MVVATGRLMAVVTACRKGPPIRRGPGEGVDRILGGPVPTEPRARPETRESRCAPISGAYGP